MMVMKKIWAADLPLGGCESCHGCSKRGPWHRPAETKNGQTCSVCGAERWWDYDSIGPWFMRRHGKYVVVEEYQHQRNKVVHKWTERFLAEGDYALLHNRCHADSDCDEHYDVSAQRFGVEEGWTRKRLVPAARGKATMSVAGGA